MQFLKSLMLVTIFFLPVFLSQAITELPPCMKVELFYRHYLTALDEPKNPNVDRVLKEHLPASLIKKVKRIQTEEGYDPIVEGQDYSPKWKTTLHVTPVYQKGNISTCKVEIDPTWKQIIIVKIKEMQIIDFSPPK